MKNLENMTPNECENIMSSIKRIVSDMDTETALSILLSALYSTSVDRGCSVHKLVVWFVDSTLELAEMEKLI